MDNLFEEYTSYEEYKNVLLEPLNADEKKTVDEHYCHFQKVYFITDDKIKHIDKIVLIKDIIKCLYFIYIDFGYKEWDDKYWFFVGKLNNEIYFTYESDCNGTGFGLGCESTLYFSKTPEYLIKYGFTNKHRELIINNIQRRFICPNV